jgi:hypothetical protein
MLPALTESRPTTSWMVVLDQIQDRIAQLQASGDKDDLLPFSSDTRNSAEVVLPLHQLESHLACLESALDKATANAADLDGLFESETASAAGTLHNMRQTRQKLADWANRAV